jgi:hypothetical protein
MLNYKDYLYLCRRFFDRDNVHNNPINYVDPYGLVHLGFVNMLRNMADKSIRKTLKSLEKRIAKHEEALKDPAQELAKKHHEHELRVFKEQHQLAKKEASRRGLIGIIPFIGTLFDPFGAEALANPEHDNDGNGVPDYLEKYNEAPCK